MPIGLVQSEDAFAICRGWDDRADNYCPRNFIEDLIRVFRTRRQDESDSHVQDSVILAPMRITLLNQMQKDRRDYPPGRIEDGTGADG